MRHSSPFTHPILQVAVAAALLAGNPISAEAAGVVVCNNCAAPQQAARQGGPGMVFVPDFRNKKLWAFENERDRETGQLMPMPRQVPGSVSSSYGRVVNIPNPAGAEVIIRQDGTGRNANLFPDGFENANAALVAGDVNLQAALGRALAANYVGATTSSVAINDLAFELISLGIDFMGAAVGFESITITLVWNDGSRTVMSMSGDHTTEAAYVRGKSYDRDGNRLPDASAIHDGDNYIGGYTFRRESTIEDWVNTASQYGIPVSGTRSNRMSCSWDGNRLTCRFY
ncbi:hypothetical protein H4F99_09085 [Lysobacter sp. SG-8]|uniref:Uncharacterized protein n=1 Tax=Marilutibacter penaei TaxID=2759900 RepID=A0A7W3U460_9GAMM|nr:hypothetical protein [Lysobacter penaei]MBB1088641.1 hypothetical protein [Lysobacter penaei]